MPSDTSGIECAIIRRLCVYDMFFTADLGPTASAPTSAAVPPVMWTTPLPAKSLYPSPPPRAWKQS